MNEKVFKIFLFMIEFIIIFNFIREGLLMEKFWFLKFIFYFCK